VSYARVGESRRLVLALMCIWVAAASVAALFIENVLGWLLFFSPGWANGWPFGLSFQLVVSVGLTGYLLLMLMTAAAGVGSIVGFICSLLGVEWEYLGPNHRIWLWAAVVLSCLIAGVFWHVYSIA
jgi:hypothetical protein